MVIQDREMVVFTLGMVTEEEARKIVAYVRTICRKS
jgi:hypothetical protein